MAVFEPQAAYYYVKHFMFVILFGSPSSPIGYVLLAIF